MNLTRRLLTTSALAIFVNLPLNFGFAAPANLSPAALDCFKSVLENPQIFTMNKNYKTDEAVEKLAVSLCTYSDAEGATKCFLQAQGQDSIMSNSKQFVNVFALEQKFAKLCSNSRKNNLNASTGDMDAVDCAKNVMSDPQVLVAAKQYMNGPTLEELVTKLCISSNGAGASKCYIKAKDRAGDLLRENKVYKGEAALDQIIVDLCKGSRL